MSITHDKLRRPGAPLGFHLRTPDGTFHGPLEIPLLCDWAAHNRIPPGSKVSEDGSTWVPAETVPELKLEWSTKSPDGRTMGPYNLLAVPLLVKGGTIPGDSVLVNRVTNRSVNVGDILRPGQTVYRKKLERTSGVEPEAVSVKREPAPAKTEADPAGKVELLTQQLVTAESNLFHAEMALGAEKNKVQTIEESVTRSRVDAARRLEQLQDIAAAGAEETRKLKADLDHEKAVSADARQLAAEKEKQLGARIRELETQAGRLSAQFANAQQTCTDLRQKDETLRQAMNNRESELNRLLEESGKAAENAAAEAGKLKVDLQYEKSLTSEARRLADEKEKKQGARVKELEARVKELSIQLTNAQQVCSELRQKDDVLQQESRKRDAEAGQRADQLQRAMESRTAEASRIKAELEREKSLHADTRRLSGEKEQQMTGRMRELEGKTREATTRLSDALQLAEERKQKYEAVQQETRHKEADAAQRLDQLQKTVDSQAKRIKESAQKMEEEQAAHVQALRESRKKEQEIAERAGRLESEAGASANLLGQAKIEAEKQKKRDQALVEQGKVRESQLSQRIEQLQGEHEQTLVVLEQAQRKLAEKQSPRAASAETGESAREKRLAAALSQFEKKAAETSRLFEHAKADAEKWKQECARQVESAGHREAELSERVASLEKALRDMSGSADGASKAAAEQKQKMRRLAEENAALSGRLMQTTLLLDQAKSDTERWEQQYTRLVGAETQQETELIARISALEKSLAEASAATANTTADHEQIYRRLTEENTDILSQLHAQEVESRAAVEKRIIAEEELSRLRMELASASAEPATQEKRRESPTTPADRSTVIPWLRPAAIAVMILCAFALGVGLDGFLKSPRAPAEKPAKTGGPTAGPAKPAVVPVAPVTPVAAAPVAVAPDRDASSPRWPDLAMSGVTVNRTTEGLVVVFDYGTFPYLSVLSDRARNDLRQIADRIRERLSEFSLVVEGCTDSVPLSTNAPYASNYDLSMARANTAAQFLIADCSLPAKSVIAVAADDSGAPYQNTDSEARKKNRTVVLKLVPIGGKRAVRR